MNEVKLLKDRLESARSHLAFEIKEEADTIHELVRYLERQIRYKEQGEIKEEILY